MSQSAGVTYIRWTGYSASSSAPQLSHVIAPDRSGCAVIGGRTVPAIVPIMMMLVAGVGCAGDDGPDTIAPAKTAPATTAPATTAPGDVSDGGEGVRGVEGVDTAVATVRREPGATPCELCLWVAADDATRRRGLMGVTDLSPAVGMAFVYDEPRTTNFTMRNTVLPLTIVFYDERGAYLDAFDMEPCTAEPCPSYPTPADFSVAVEVPRGDAGSLGLVPGSQLVALGGDCDTPVSG